MIELDDFSVVLGGTFKAVKNVSLGVSSGEIYGLVGESGCGKSTLLRAIAGALPFSGSLLLNGEPLTSKRQRSQRKLMQMVFQDPYGSLHPAHTVDQILAEALAIGGVAVSEDRIAAALESVGLNRRHRFRFPHQLSGGQRQRVGIARALIVEPKVLLLDEPTSALDVSIQAEILNLLKRLRNDLGLTMLLVSHDLGVIAHMCDRVSVMYRGEFVETTTADHLRTGAVEHAYTRMLLEARPADASLET